MIMESDNRTAGCYKKRSEMKSAPKQYRDGIFLVTAEQSCPLYSVGDELKVENFKPQLESCVDFVLGIGESDKIFRGFDRS